MVRSDAGGGRTVSAHEVRAWLVERFAKRLNMKPEAVDCRQPPAAFGLDSMEAMSLFADLQQWLGRSLDPGMLWEAKSLDGFAEALAGKGSAPRGPKAG